MPVHIGPCTALAADAAKTGIVPAVVAFVAVAATTFIRKVRSLA